MTNFTDNTKPQTVARFFALNRQDKSGTNWGVLCLNSQYANVAEGDDDFQKDAPSFCFLVKAENMSDEFEIVDPVTLESTGEKATIGQVFAFVQSLWMHEAKKQL